MDTKKNNLICVAFFILSMFGLPNKAEAKDCPYCNGRGYTIKNTDVAGYGLSQTKKKCEVCGEWVWSNTAHQHVACKHCNQTGTAPSQSSSSSNGLNSYGNAGTAQGRLNAIAQDNPRAYGTAMSIKYGFPMTDAEYEDYRRLAPDVAASYLKLRNTLEEGLIHFNQSTAMMNYRSDSPDRIYNYMNQLVKSIDSYQPVLNGRLTQTLLNHLQQLSHMVEQSGEQYYNTTVYFSQMNNLQNSLDNYRLRMNLF